MSWFVRSLTFLLVKASKVECYHDVLSILVGDVVLSIFILSFSNVVIGSIHQELLRSTLWLLDDVSNKDWDVRNLELCPSLSLVPRISDLGGGLEIWCSYDKTSMVSKVVD